MHLSPVYHIQLPLLALSKSKTAFFLQIKKPVKSREKQELNL